MISRTSLARWAFVVCLLLSGCVPRTVRVMMDGLPDHWPKGYVAFTARYIEGRCGSRVQGYRLPVKEVINGKYKHLGGVYTLPYQGLGTYVLRVAAKPGPHTYSINFLRFTREQVVNIENGRVTPVRIDIRCTDTREESLPLGRSIIHYYGDAQFRTSDSVPLEEWKKREDAFSPRLKFSP